MADLGEVLNALVNCTAHPKCRDCGWKECEYEHETVEIPLTLAKDALSLLKAQEPGWISVKDRMPDENVAVNIVWVNTDPESYYEDIKDKPFTATGVYFRGKWYWWSSVVQDYLAEYGVGFTDRMDESIIVTHWLPLPEPPKEET